MTFNLSTRFIKTVTVRQSVIDTLLQTTDCFALPDDDTQVIMNAESFGAIEDLEEFGDRLGINLIKYSKQTVRFKAST